MKVDIIAIMVVHGYSEWLTAFSKDEDGKGEAEQFFRDEVLKVNPDVTEREMKDYLEDGYFMEADCEISWTESFGY